MRVNRVAISTAAVFGLTVPGAVSPAAELHLWYRQPASAWTGVGRTNTNGPVHTAISPKSGLCFSRAARRKPRTADPDGNARRLAAFAAKRMKRCVPLTRREGKLVEATIHSCLGKPVKVRYRNAEISLVPKRVETVEVVARLKAEAR